MSMKLAILGLLLEGDHHPYEIRIKMKDRGMDQYTKLQMGSLYYAVDRLVEEGYIEAVETIQSDSRPDKTIYRITESGRKLLNSCCSRNSGTSSPCTTRCIWRCPSLATQTPPFWPPSCRPGSGKPNTG